MSSATSGFGTLLKAGDAASPEVFTTVAEVVNISGPALSMDTIDVTNHDSANNHREKIASLLDTGEVTFTINYLPANATHNATAGLVDYWEQRTRRNWQLVFTDTGNTTWSFTALVTGFEPNAPIDDKLSADVTLMVVAYPTLA